MMTVQEFLSLPSTSLPSAQFRYPSDFTEGLDAWECLRQLAKSGRPSWDEEIRVTWIGGEQVYEV